MLRELGLIAIRCPKVLLATTVSVFEVCLFVFDTSFVVLSTGIVAGMPMNPVAVRTGRNGWTRYLRLNLKNVR